MKPNELRIGNWVSHEDYSTEMFRVKTICYGGDENNYVVNTIGGKNGEWINPIDLIRPIPLTEELLVKCGFEKQTSDYETSHPDYCEWLERKYPVIGVVYQSDAKDCLLAEINGEEVHIHNLHQLQNLYFALTGEELNIEL